MGSTEYPVIFKAVANKQILEISTASFMLKDMCCDSVSRILEIKA